MSTHLPKLGQFLLSVKSIAPHSLYDDSDFTYIDISSIDRDSKSIVNPQVISTSEAPSRARQELAQGDVIVSTVRPNLNTVAMVMAAHANAIASTGFCVLRPDPNRLDARYLYHWISSEITVRRLASLATGATYPAVSDKIIKSLELSLPPLLEQQRIANILDKAESLSSKRKEAIVLVDDFLRSMFFELFGDPNVNEKHWPERAIAEISKVTTGSTPSRKIPAYYGDAIEWIKSDNINTLSHWLTRAREGLSELGTSIARTVPAGSTLMTCIAGSASCIGNVALSNRKVAFNQQINAMTPAFGIDPEFLYALLLYSKPRIQATSTNSMKGMVSKGVLEKIHLIWPPTDLQKKFVKIFKHVQRFSSRMEYADALTLTAALQSKLFV